MRQGAVYIRVSTDDQTEYSPDAQLKRIKEYAQNHDILISQEYIYIENGVSGRTVAKREQFKKMIQKAKEKPKPFDVVLIHAYDRFARNVKESRIYKELLRDDLGIELISITEDFGSGKNSFLMEGIKDILNEYYSLNLRDEVLKGMYEKVSRGEVCGKAVLGYNLINKKLIINEEEAKTIKLIFDRYAYNNLGLLDIAKLVNQMGLRTKTGNKFENRTIKYILRNPIYIGKLRYSKKGRVDYHLYTVIKEEELYDGIHERIIDEETWNIVQKRLDKNMLFSVPHKIDTVNADYWLKGIVRCPYCNNTMIRHQKINLRCNGYGKGKCHNKTTINLKFLEKLVLNQMKQDFDGKKISLNTIKIKSNECNERDIIIRQINNTETKFARIKEAYVDGIDTLEEYKKNKEIISREINILKEILDKIEKPKEVPKDNLKLKIKDIYDLLTNEKVEMSVKKNAAHMLINKIVVDEKNMKILLTYNESPF